MTEFLQDSIKKITGVAFKGKVFFHVVSTAPGRNYIITAPTLFTPRGIPVYLACLDEKTMERKIVKKMNEHGIRFKNYARNRIPHVLLLNLDNVLDLRNETTLRKLEVDKKNLLFPETHITRRLGRLTRDIFEAIIFPSLEGDCILIFKNSIDSSKNPQKKIKIKRLNHLSLIDYIESKLT